MIKAIITIALLSVSVVAFSPANLSMPVDFSSTTPNQEFEIEKTLKEMTVLELEQVSPENIEYMGGDEIRRWVLNNSYLIKEPFIDVLSLAVSTPFKLGYSNKVSLFELGESVRYFESSKGGYTQIHDRKTGLTCSYNSTEINFLDDLDEKLDDLGLREYQRKHLTRQCDSDIQEGLKINEGTKMPNELTMTNTETLLLEIGFKPKHLIALKELFELTIKQIGDEFETYK